MLPVSWQIGFGTINGVAGAGGGGGGTVDCMGLPCFTIMGQVLCYVIAVGHYFNWQRLGVKFFL